MKIVFLDAGTLYDVPNLNILKEIGDVTFFHHTTDSEVLEKIKDADVVITNKVKISRETIRSCEKLKLICVAATGTNNIDLEAANDHHIPVKNVSNYSTDSVAQVTFTMLLYLLNNPWYYDQYVKSGEYVNNIFFTHIGRPFYELKGKQWGIIGLGNIGKKVAEIAAAFGMKVIYTSVSGKNINADYPHLPLDTLLKTSDVVSLHTPLTPQTTGLINYAKIKLMKPDAYLINVGRGGLVVEKDLVAALDEDLIAGAALDVFEREPIHSDSPIYALKSKNKLVCSPHIAWASVEARMELVNQIYHNIKALKD